MYKKLKFFLIAFFQELVEYRGDVLVYTATSFVLPVILMQVWIAVFEARNGNTQQQSYIISYFYIQTLVNVLVGAWHGPFLSRRIREGEISQNLLKPFPYIFYWICQNLSEKIWKVLLSLPLIGILFIFYHKYISILSITALLFFLISIIFALCINFLIEYIIALSSFWFSNTQALLEFNEMLFFVTSGRLFPLTFLSALIPLKFINLLPYKYIISFPIEILLNNLSVYDLLNGIASQLLWIMLLYFTYRILWIRGLKVYGGYGG